MEPLNAMKMLPRFLKSEPSLPYANSDESFVMNGKQWSYSFLSDRGRPSPSPSPSPLSTPSRGVPSPWHSPILTPLLDGRSYGCIATMVRQDGHVYALAASSHVDGLLYTASESQNIRVWKQPSFNEYGYLRSGSGSVKAILIVGDKVLSAHRDHKIRVWRRGKRVATLPTVKDQIQSSVNPKKYVHVRRHQKAQWMKHADAISSLAANQEEGVLYSGSWDKTVKVWRMSDWKCVESIQAHHDAVNSLVVGPDGLLFTGSADCTVKVWRRLKAEAKHLLTQTLHLHHSGVNGLAVTADGGILYAGSADGIVNYWENKHKTRSFLQHAGFLGGHKLAILCLATVTNLVMSGSADKTIRVWRRDAIAGLHSCLAVLQGHSGPIKSITATATNGFACVYSGGLDRSVKVWLVHNDMYVTNPVLCRLPGSNRN